MKDPFIARTIRGVDQKRMTDDVFHLADSPIPMRKLNLTLPDHSKNTLYEADDFLAAQLKIHGYEVQREAVRVQACRCDTTKPKAHQYSRPLPDDPWYDAYNLYAERCGQSQPEEIIFALGS